MLTDTEARDLLHAAADTIEVEPDHPLPMVERPRIWPMLVAAAAVVAVVATTLALADRGPEPQQPSTSPAPTPTVNRIPPVIGLDPAAAIERLEEVDLKVRTRTKPGCVSQRVAEGTTPPVGSRFSPGDKVQLTVLDDSMDFCDGTQNRAWELLRFALGVDSPPAFADQVTLYPGGGEAVVLSDSEAADPANWEVCDGDLCGSALSILTTAATQPSPTGAGPVLTVWEQPRSFDGTDQCTGGADIEGDGLYLGITIAPPMDGISLCPQVSALFSSRTGRLEAVAIPLYSKSDVDPDPTPSAEAMTAAEQFVAWARGSRSMPRFADEVDLRQGGLKMASISAVEARDPEAWVPCHRMVSNCPLPIPRLLRERGEIRFSALLPEGSCRPVDQGPSTWQPDVTLTWRIASCRGWIALQLGVDDAGSISAANLVLGR